MRREHMRHGRTERGALCARGRSVPWAGLLGLVGLLLVGTILGGCGAPPARLSQGQGLPELRHLNWGYPYTAPIGPAAWSPNGRWIALQAEASTGGSHLVVVSPDGRSRQDLAGWGCGENTSFSAAWLPDSSLSCITDSGQLIVGAAPFTTPRAVTIQSVLTPGGEMAAWSPDGTVLLVASLTDPADPVHNIQPPRPYTVTPQGQVGRVSLAPAISDVSRPAWVPHTATPTLSYILGSGDTQVHTLVVSPLTLSAQGSGGGTLGPPRVLAQEVYPTYAWAPSGHWVAVRPGNVDHPDEIYLVDPTEPTHTVDVVLADRTGVQMTDPIWSPDGETLIVFSVAYGASEPYALDIGAYLRGLGLQP